MHLIVSIFAHLNNAYFCILVVKICVIIFISATVKISFESAYKTQCLELLILAWKPGLGNFITGDLK